MRIDIDIQGADELLRQFDIAPDIVREELTAAMVESQALAEREAKEGTPIGVGAAGGLRGSIAALTPEFGRGEVIGVVGSALDYAVPVELGTKPHFPPILYLTGEQESLDDWVRSPQGLGIDDDEEAVDVALAVARKIASQGTEGAFMFEEAFEATQAQVQQNFAEARDRIGARLGGARV